MSEPSTPLRDERCEVCRHYYTLPQWKKAFINGECRRHSPKIDPEGLLDAKFPRTHWADWCGDFQQGPETE